MAPPKGSKNAQKLKTPDIRQRAYKKYCDWLALGKSSRTFTFKEDDIICVGKTIENYMKADPVNFPPLHKEYAEAKGEEIWEEIVADSAKGINEKANTASLQMIMRNKYGWDKRADREPLSSEQIKESADLLASIFKPFLEKSE